LGAAVPIYEILRKQGVFTPEEVAMLGDVFEDVLKILGLVDRKDPLTIAVAQKVIELRAGGYATPSAFQSAADFLQSCLPKLLLFFVRHLHMTQ
jgi:hypothetical protein